MSKSKLTPWFPSGSKPVREGIYQRRYGRSDIAYARWDGDVWLAGAYTFDLAMKRTILSLRQALPWRGLASNPSTHKETA